MKIALCLEYPISQHGGVEVLVSELIQGLGDRHDVILVSPDNADSLAKSSVAASVKMHIPFAAGKFSAQSARRLAANISAAKPDIVHFHFGGNYGWNNRAFWKCPIFYLDKSIPRLSTNHGAFSILEGYCGEHRTLLKFALFLPAWLSKQIILTRLHREIAVSQNDFRNLRRWYPAMKKKFQWIYHSRLHGNPPPENPNREKIILCAGTIGARKGQPLLAESFAHIAKKFPDWRLVFVGRYDNNEYVRKIRQIIANEGLENRIQLAGSRSDDELCEYLKRAAIFAMPSVYEGLGLALQEAQFYGCACVATRCGGTTDLIDDGENGFLVPVGQPAPLAEALEKLMNDQMLRERFSRRAPQSVLEKSMIAEKMVAAYEKLYAGIVEGI